MDYIKKFDFISYKAHFTFNDKGDKRYKTLMGGILSLISLIISFSFITYFLYRLIYKEDASIMFYSERDSNINISYSYKLPFMFRLSDSYSIALKQQNLYNISLLVWYSYINNETNQLIQNYDKIIVEKCNIDKHFNGYKNYFNNIPDLESYFCPRERLNNQSLYGIYGNHKPFIYYVFYFSKCNNLTNNNLCLTNEEINNYLSNAYLDLKFLSYSVNSFNHKNSKLPIIISERFIISSTIYKTISLLFNKIKFITDNGLLFESKYIENYHQYENSKIHIDLREMFKSNNFLSVEILNSGNVNIYKKNYLKIQDYLATIGGIIKAITYICSSLNYFNAKNSYYSKLIRDFLIENQIKKKKNQNHKTNEILLDKSDNIFIKHSNPQIHINQYAKNRNTLNNKNSNYNVIYKLRDKDIFSNKYKLKFLPFNSCIRSYSDRKEIKWYIKIINKRLNIINVLNVLEQCDKLRKEVDNSILNSHNSVLTPIHSAYMSFMHNNYINHNEYKKSDGKKNGIV